MVILEDLKKAQWQQLIWNDEDNFDPVEEADQNPSTDEAAGLLAEMFANSDYAEQRRWGHRPTDFWRKIIEGKDQAQLDIINGYFPQEEYSVQMAQLVSQIKIGNVRKGKANKTLDEWLVIVKGILGTKRCGVFTCQENT